MLPNDNGTANGGRLKRPLARETRPEVVFDSDSGFLAEVMSSLQTEGPFVGCRQIVLRFMGCNLRCAFCDTPATFTPARQCRIETSPGTRDFAVVPNPFSVEQLLQWIQALRPESHHGATITGGEPLLQAAFLRVLAPGLQRVIPQTNRFWAAAQEGLARQ